MMKKCDGLICFIATLLFVSVISNSVVFAQEENKEKKKEPAGTDETAKPSTQEKIRVGELTIPESQKANAVIDETPTIEVAYENGKPHGKAILRYFSGARIEGEYDHGKEIGLWISYDKEGKKYRQESYKNGKRDGKYITWESGYVCEIDYKDGLLHGKQCSWDKNGKLIYEFGYKDGKPHGRHISWYLNGNKHMEGYFNEGTGKLSTWHENGTISTEAEFKNGRKYGKEIWWHENGRKSQEQTFNEEGKNIGKLTHWYEDGKVAYEMEFDQDGKRLYKRDYDRDGNLIFDNDRPVDKKKTVNSHAATPPPVYDLRNVDGIKRVTGVKDQLQTKWSHTCWAFGYIGALESNLMCASSQPPPEPDYSEQHLADKNHGWDVNGLAVGGKFRTALAYLTRGGGPIDEADMRYDPEHALGKQISFPAKKWIREVQRGYDHALWAYGHDEFCQEHIFAQQHGGVAANMYFDPACFNGANSTYYRPLVHNPGTNHTVVLVGWNNTYPKENFTYNGFHPSTDGALIVKNSWGRENVWPGGDDGYFYISMETLAFYPTIAFADVAEPTCKYIYQYDLLGYVTNITFSSSECTYANVYTAENPDGTIDNLRTVGFYLPYNSLGYCMFNYTISVYTDLTNANIPTSGTLVASITGKDGWYQYGGYYTRDLPNPIPIKGGSRFSIVIKNSRLAWPDPNNPECGFTVEQRVAPPAVPDTPIPVSTLNASSKWGESFLLATTGWQDLKVVFPTETLNACIKAFTDGNFDHYWKLKEALDDPTLNVSSDNGYNLNWTRVTDDSHPGKNRFVAKSDWVNTGERCHMDAVIDGPKLMNFYWKVSSDPGNALKFYVDGTEKNSISGAVDWQQVQTSILTPGTHKLEWSYEKAITPTATSTAADCGWVDGFCQAYEFTVISPNGGEGWPRGAKQAITWICGDIAGNLRIELFKDDVLIGLIAEVPANPGIYTWDVGRWEGGQVPPASGYKIRIRTPDGTLLKARLQTVK